MGLAPENTLESFELAFDLGAHMIELDVHRTRDGKLVVIQDAKRLAPEIAGAVLEVSRLASPGRYVASVVGADGWNPGCVLEADSIGFGSVAYETRGAAALDRASVRDAHDQGVAVFVWTE